MHGVRAGVAVRGEDHGSGGEAVAEAETAHGGRQELKATERRRRRRRRRIKAAVPSARKAVEPGEAGTPRVDPPVPLRASDGRETPGTPDPLAERAAWERREVERRATAEPCSCPSCKREDAEEQDRRVFWY